MTTYFSAYSKPENGNSLRDRPEACMARLWPKSKAKAMQSYFDNNYMAQKTAQSLSKEPNHANA